MRAKKISDIINEWGGAGYSIYGGNAGYGNASGRGMGFGQSSQNKGGPNLMYTYDVKDLDQKLQQAPTPQDNEKYIHVGCEIEGDSLDTKKKISGKIVSEETDNDGNISYYNVINSKTGKTERVDPTSAELIQKDLSPEMAIRDYPGFESFEYPSFEDFLNEKDNAREAVKRSHLPKDIKEKVLKLGVSRFENGRAHIGKPKIKGRNFDGVGMGADKNGFYVYTHRARSKSKSDPSEITSKEVKFIRSTR
jgi:hypothetical protein